MFIAGATLFSEGDTPVVQVDKLTALCVGDVLATFYAAIGNKAL